MKNILFILLLAPCIAFAPIGVNMSTISTAISKGDVETLFKYFDSKIELSILDDEDIYNKNTAKQKLTKFFGEFTPKAFNQVHQGTSKGQDSQYLIGDLKTSGSTFRVYLYMKTDGDAYLIQEIRFDKE